MTAIFVAIDSLILRNVPIRVKRCSSRVPDDGCRTRKVIGCFTHYTLRQNVAIDSIRSDEHCQVTKVRLDNVDSYVMSVFEGLIESYISLSFSFR